MFLRINSTQHYLRRTAPARQRTRYSGPVPPKRGGGQRFFRKLLKGLEYVPRVIVTDKLGSYQVAHRELLGSVEHRRSKYLNKPGTRSPVPANRGTVR
ncbi:DDE-type integrase/transposase/recombinase [Aldersonia kunmingensis]|uniref:DDE-type integrase/transposase/recombinase n=1 Tax=Aldersonia kunmingensis TaxID=408066 RepID=UPI003CCBA3D1